MLEISERMHRGKDRMKMNQEEEYLGAQVVRRPDWKFPRINVSLTLGDGRRPSHNKR